jgi:hypothetical protein
MNALRSDLDRQVIEPPRAELDTLRAMFAAGMDGWRKESPRNTQLRGLLETELVKLRSGG